MLASRLSLNHNVSNVDGDKRNGTTVHKNWEGVKNYKISFLKKYSLRSGSRKSRASFAMRENAAQGTELAESTNNSYLHFKPFDVVHSMSLRGWLFLNSMNTILILHGYPWKKINENILWAQEQFIWSEFNTRRLLDYTTVFHLNRGQGLPPVKYGIVLWELSVASRIGSIRDGVCFVFS